MKKNWRNNGVRLTQENFLTQTYGWPLSHIEKGFLRALLEAGDKGLDKLELAEAVYYIVGFRRIYDIEPWVRVRVSVLRRKLEGRGVTISSEKGGRGLHATYRLEFEEDAEQV